MKLRIWPALAALLLTAPAISAEEAPTEIAPKADPMDEMISMFGAMFSSEPLSAEAKARLPAAREIAAYLVPEGSYRTLMDETFKGMFDGMGDLMKPGPTAAVAKLTGVGEDDLLYHDEETLQGIAAVLDPSYVERADIGMKVIMDGVSDIMVQAEPTFREGYAEAFAEHFTAEQLAELKAFFQTPTGSYYASKSLLVASDPRVLSKTPTIFPMIMGEMPQILEKMETETAHLPPERYFDMLDPVEQARLADLLGQPVEDLAAASAQARAQAEQGDAALGGTFGENAESRRQGAD